MMSKKNYKTTGFPEEAQVSDQAVEGKRVITLPLFSAVVAGNWAQ